VPTRFGSQSNTNAARRNHSSELTMRGAYEQIAFARLSLEWLTDEKDLL
jgi:hypothetical protein